MLTLQSQPQEIPIVPLQPLVDREGIPRQFRNLSLDGTQQRNLSNWGKTNHSFSDAADETQ